MANKLLDQTAKLIELITRYMKNRDISDPNFTKAVGLISSLKKHQINVFKTSKELYTNRDDPNALEGYKKAMSGLTEYINSIRPFINEHVYVSRDSDDSSSSSGSKSGSGNTSNSEEQSSNNSSDQTDRPAPLSGTSKPPSPLPRPGSGKVVPVELTFMSIDVKGSETIKVGENPQNIQKTFTAYSNFVEAIVKRYGVKKFGWAGDGFICYFDLPDDAMCSAVEIVSSLPFFNITRNSVGKPIKVRIGIAGGEDFFDTQMPIGKLASKVIDLSAYLQKKAELESFGRFGRILISKLGYNLIRNKENFRRSVKFQKVELPPDSNKGMGVVDCFEVKIQSST